MKAATQESVPFGRLKREVGRQLVVVRLTEGRIFVDPLRSVDKVTQILTFGSSKRPRLVKCSEISSLEFEPRARRNKRSNWQVMLATLTLPAAIAVIYSGYRGLALPALIWPGGIAWGGPASRGIVPRESSTYKVTCP